MPKHKPVPGQSHNRNKNLACAVCGIPFMRDKFELWVIGLHMQLWHDTEEIKLITYEKNTRINVPEPVDMATSKEILSVLAKLQEAVVEARQVTAELHSGVKDYAYLIKQQNSAIRTAVNEVIEDHLHNLEIDVKQSFQKKVDEVIEEIAQGLHEKLAL